jgi:hypothetical protein
MYTVMWENGRPEGPESRLIRAGWDRLGKLANLTPNNARLACGRLISKLAIEVAAPENSAARIGRSYRVWSWAKLVKLRKAVGMEWYVKTRGVRFVRPPAEYPDACALWDAHVAAATEKGTVPEKRMEAIPVSGAGSVPFSGRDYLKHSKSIERRGSSSSALAPSQAGDADLLRRHLMAYAAAWGTGEIKCSVPDEDVLMRCLAIAPVQELIEALQALKEEAVRDRAQTPCGRKFVWFVEVFRNKIKGR